MKLVLTGLALLATSAFAQSNPQDCFKIKNNLDRRYCVDKYIETVREKNASEKSAWDANGISSADRSAKVSALEADVQAKKDHIALLQSEITLSEKHISDVKAAKDGAVAAAAPAPEKKKKKKGFRIKL